MCIYVVKIVEDVAAILDAEKLFINKFRPETSEYKPETFAQVVFVRDSGLLCRMESSETELRAMVTEDDGDVHTDSCMEFFVNFNPMDGSHYINLEGNPIGILKCKYGSNRFDRVPLSSIGCTMRPTVTAKHFPGGWSIEYFIPIELICSVFKCEHFQHGDIFRGNFYKCGDWTCHPHFGMWNWVDTEVLDFHSPEYFGQLILD